MKAQHTPTPWRKFGTADNATKIEFGVSLIKLPALNEDEVPGMITIQSGFAKGDRDLILRAVNSHDTLVRLLEQALSELLGKSASTGDEFIEEVERELVKAKK